MNNILFANTIITENLNVHFRNVDYKRIDKAYSALSLLYKYFEKNDVYLHYRNGKVSEQLGVALAALDTIYQELEF